MNISTFIINILIIMYALYDNEISIQKSNKILNHEVNKMKYALILKLYISHLYITIV